MMVMPVIVAMGDGRNHPQMLYYNITGVHAVAPGKRLGAAKLEKRETTLRRHSGATRQRRATVRNCAPENLEIPGLVLTHQPGNDGANGQAFSNIASTYSQFTR